jgi:hypothetical protein
MGSRRVSIAARLGAVAAATAVSLFAAPAAVPSNGPSLHFSTFVSSDLPLGQIVWTGDRFLYVAEGRPTLGVIETSDGAGRNVATFASFDQGGEEMRCYPAPVQPAYWPQGVYCHTPDNRILRVSSDGSSVTQLARLPVSNNSDGSLAFDTVGRFGYALLAATGGSASSGGQVFAIRTSGKVETIGSYPGPGGAENAAVAPAKFGSASGQLLLALDQDHVSGSVLAIDRKGKVQTVATGLGNGLNPIMVVKAPPAKPPAGAPAAGVYLADTVSKKVFFAAASDLKGFGGSVLVGAELTGQLWLIHPLGTGFSALPVTTDLPAQAYNLEGSTYVP